MIEEEAFLGPGVIVLPNVVIGRGQRGDDLGSSTDDRDGESGAPSSASREATDRRGHLPRVHCEFTSVETETC